MADETNIGATGAPAAEPKNTGHEQQHMIPKARFDEINNAYKEIKTQLDQLREQQQQANETRLAEQQKWQELAEKRAARIAELEPYQNRVKEIEDALSATVKARIERLPEDARGMVPDFGDARKTLTWLDANEARLMRPPAPNMDAGARGETSNAKAELTQEELQMAKLMGMDTEDFAAFKARKAKQQQQQQSAGWMQNLGSRSTGE